jgi:hypothetical protein
MMIYEGSGFQGILPGMSTRSRSQAGPPMTLGNMRANGVRVLDVSCWLCHDLMRVAHAVLGSHQMKTKFAAQQSPITVLMAVLIGGLALAVALSLAAAEKAASADLIEPQFIVATFGPPGKPAIVGTTNLPDDTELMVSVTRPESGYHAQDKVTVISGRFRTGQFSRGQSPLSAGTYSIEIVMPYSFTQPESVRSIIGPKGERLTGKLVRIDNVLGATFGRTLRFLTEFTVSDEIFTPLGASGITAEDTLGCSTERAFAIMHLAWLVARDWKEKDLPRNFVDYESEECVKLSSGTRFTVESLSTVSACLKLEGRSKCYWTLPPGSADGLRVVGQPAPAPDATVPPSGVVSGGGARIRKR